MQKQNFTRQEIIQILETVTLFLPYFHGDSLWAFSDNTTFKKYLWCYKKFTLKRTQCLSESFSPHTANIFCFVRNTMCNLPLLGRYSIKFCFKTSQPHSKNLFKPHLKSVILLTLSNYNTLHSCRLFGVIFHREWIHHCSVVHGRAHNDFSISKHPQ